MLLYLLLGKLSIKIGFQNLYLNEKYYQTSHRKSIQVVLFVRAIWGRVLNFALIFSESMVFIANTV